MTENITQRTFTITIECNNAAFDGDACGEEVARILRELASDLDGGDVEDDATFFLFDLNGNRCGDAEMTVEDCRR
jgi:hypothetical protein